MIYPFSKTKDNEKYWKDRKIDWVSHYWMPEHKHRDLLIKILKTQPPRSVLEVGCATGSNLYRIKKEFPDCRICGCDINADAIKTAEAVFRQEFPAEHFDRPAIDSIADIDFRVGAIDEIPFHGEYFDLVLTDACLIYTGPEKINRVMRELRRVGYDRFMFSEFHSDSWLKRLGLRLARNYYAYDYNRLLAKHFFKHIKVVKMPKDMFGGEPWTTFGSVITAIR
jgi:ubiquinone/menaquinone biosynthesis C-methylase UbiE